MHALARKPLTPTEVEAIRVRKCRLASLQAVDRGVRRIVAALGSELSNTLFAFVSDNGYMLGEHRIAKAKALLYEESSRVPLVLRGPGVGTRRGGRPGRQRRPPSNDPRPSNDSRRTRDRAVARARWHLAARTLGWESTAAACDRAREQKAPGHPHGPVQVGALPDRQAKRRPRALRPRRRPLRAAQPLHVSRHPNPPDPRGTETSPRRCEGSRPSWRHAPGIGVADTVGLAGLPEAGRRGGDARGRAGAREGAAVRRPSASEAVTTAQPLTVYNVWRPASQLHMA